MNIYSQELPKETVKRWYKPAIIQVQYAGNLGMLSAGLSWKMLHDNVELNYSVGYAPEFAIGEDIYVTALKGLYTPELDFKINDNLLIKPLALGIVCNYTFGNQYSKFQNDDIYPEGYYWWNTSYRFGVLYQAEFLYKIDQKHIKGIGIYCETSIWDLYLYSLIDNSNTQYLNLWDITTLGVGIKFYFE